MKHLLIAIFSLITFGASAQVEQVTLQASGLTCSMCSKAIFKALEKLSLSDNITSSIQESTYTLQFKSNEAVNFDAIRQAVEDAGFSVVKMEVKANFDKVKIYNDAHVMLNGESFHFLNVKEQILSGEQTFRIVDKKFVEDKMYKKYAATTQMPCVKTGLMKSCCTKGSVAGSRIYHVTV